MNEYFPDEIKTPRIFCSQACRWKAYRRRQDQARQRHDQGLSVAEIAAIMGSEAATVEKWTRKRAAGREQDKAAIQQEESEKGTAWARRGAILQRADGR